MYDLSDVTWRKSTRSGANQCVEVADLLGGVAVRDSKDPGGPALIFDRGAWAAFVGGTRDGAFDR